MTIKSRLKVWKTNYVADNRAGEINSDERGLGLGLGDLEQKDGGGRGAVTLKNARTDLGWLEIDKTQPVMERDGGHRTAIVRARDLQRN